VSFALFGEIANLDAIACVRLLNAGFWEISFCFEEATNRFQSRVRIQRADDFRL